jgi:hypothetical protein
VTDGVDWNVTDGVTEGVLVIVGVTEGVLVIVGVTEGVLVIVGVTEGVGGDSGQKISFNKSKSLGTSGHHSSST